MHGSTGRGWKRSLGHRASPSPYRRVVSRFCDVTSLVRGSFSELDVARRRAISTFTWI